jgi:hypothetical protein
MYVFSQDEIHKIEFPDCRLIYFTATERVIEFACDRVFVEGRGLLDGTAKVSIFGWRTCHIQRHDSESRESKELQLTESGVLREICECSLGGPEVKLAGFENDGCWQEYRFSFAIVSVMLT